MTKEEKQTISLLSFSHFFCHVAILAFPAILILLKNKFHVSYVTLGIVAGTYLFLFGGGSLPIGFVADKVSKKFILRLYLIGMSIVSFLAALSGNFYMFSFFIILMGLIGSIYHPVGLSIMSYVGSDKLKGFAIHGVAGTMGVAVSAGFAGMLGYFYGYSAPYLVLGIIFLFIFIYSFFLKFDFTSSELNRSLKNFNKSRAQSDPNKNIKEKNGVKDIKDNRRFSKLSVFIKDFFHKNLILILVAEFLNGFVFQGVFSFLPAYAGMELKNFLFFNDQPAAAGGFFVTIALLIGVVFQYSSTYITKRFRPQHAFSFLIAASGSFLIVASLSHNFMLFFSILFFAAFNFSLNPISNLMVTLNTSEYYRATAYGIFFFSGFGIGSIAAPIGGIIAHNYTLSDVFLFYGLVMMVSFILSNNIKSQAFPA